MFQSSPNPKVGCYRDTRAEFLPPSSFNPHPTRRLDATVCRDFQYADTPGFNPHPTRRLDATCPEVVVPLAVCVSILIQPEGWMLRFFHPSVAIIPDRFNPHPTRRLD